MSLTSTTTAATRVTPPPFRPLPAGIAVLLDETVASRETPLVGLATARSSGPISLHVAGAARWRASDGAPATEPAPAGQDTIFLLASITKPVTATAIMQLAERGRLLLDDPVARHVPEFGANGKGAVTVRQVLSHTSGLDEAAVDGAWTADRRSMITQHSRVASVCQAGLAFAPGTMQQYCSAGYRILAEIVERLSGLDFARYVAQRITGPLGMADTSFDPPPSATDRLADVAPPSWPRPEREFRRWGMTLDEMVADFRAIPYAGGGLWSTLPDLIALGRSYLHSLSGSSSGPTGLLAPATLRAMLRPHTRGLCEPAEPARPGPVRGLGFVLYGLGGQDFCGRRTFGHGGSTGTLLLIDPDLELVVVYLANHWRWNARARSLAVNAAITASSYHP